MVTWPNHILCDPQILHGKPCFTNTRIPVALILGYLANGQSPSHIITEFPNLTEHHISSALAFARDLADPRVVQF